MSRRVVLDPNEMRRAARAIEEAALETTRGNTDVRQLLDSGLSPMSREAVRSAHRSTRDVPDSLRAVARQLRVRADLIERSQGSFDGAGAGRIAPPKWLRNPAMTIARKSVRISGLIRRLHDQARDYAHLADKARQGTFWGNFCGSGNKGETLAPSDTLDSCCKTHDAAYKRLGVTATTQFTPAGLMKTAEANRALSHCATLQPDGTERGDVQRFDPNKKNNLGIQGDDARSGVMKLFALMALIGAQIAAAQRRAAAAIDDIPFVSAARAKEIAAWAMDKAAREIIDQHRRQLAELGALV